MIALLWIIAALASLVTLTYLVSATVAALRALQPARAAVSAALTVLFGVVAFGLRQPVVLLLLRRIGRLGGDHAPEECHAKRLARLQTTKLSAAHLTLLTGSFLFLIPFAWLLSTSLKTDEEQAVFPPVWIPTQQVESAALKNAEGKPAGLSYWMRPDGTKTLVAETEELPDGHIRIEPLQAPTGGNESQAVLESGVVPPDPVTRKELTKIRHTDPRWENYQEALEYLPADSHYGLVFLRNTLFLTLMTTLGTVISSSLVAFSFARLNWPGRNILFGVLLATMMIPGAVTMMPQFLIYRSLGWIDTLRPLWVASFFGSAFNIFLLRQFFLSIPAELEDAARIDGCGPWGIYWRIMLPMVKPALAAIAIMSVLGAWNNFQGPLIYLSSPEKMPLAYALQLYQQQHGGEPGLLMAASTLVVLPIIVLFFFTQRYFIEGVSLTGLGGR